MADGNNSAVVSGQPDPWLTQGGPVSGLAPPLIMDQQTRFNINNQRSFAVQSNHLTALLSSPSGEKGGAVLEPSQSEYALGPLRLHDTYEQQSQQGDMNSISRSAGNITVTVSFTFLKYKVILIDHLQSLPSHNLQATLETAIAHPRAASSTNHAIIQDGNEDARSDSSFSLNTFSQQQQNHACMPVTHTSVDLRYCVQGSLTSITFSEGFIDPFQRDLVSCNYNGDHATLFSLSPSRLPTPESMQVDFPEDIWDEFEENRLREEDDWHEAQFALSQSQIEEGLMDEETAATSPTLQEDHSHSVEEGLCNTNTLIAVEDSYQRKETLILASSFEEVTREAITTATDSNKSMGATIPATVSTETLLRELSKKEPIMPAPTSSRTAELGLESLLHNTIFSSAGADLTMNSVPVATLNEKNTGGIIVSTGPDEDVFAQSRSSYKKITYQSEGTIRPTTAPLKETLGNLIVHGACSDSGEKVESPAAITGTFREEVINTQVPEKLQSHEVKELLLSPQSDASAKLDINTEERLDLALAQDRQVPDSQTDHRQALPARTSSDDKRFEDAEECYDDESGSGSVLHAQVKPSWPSPVVNNVERSEDVKQGNKPEAQMDLVCSLSEPSILLQSGQATALEKEGNHDENLPVIEGNDGDESDVSMDLSSSSPIQQTIWMPSTKDKPNETTYSEAECTITESIDLIKSFPSTEATNASAIGKGPESRKRTNSVDVYGSKLNSYSFLPEYKRNKTGATQNISSTIEVQATLEGEIEAISRPGNNSKRSLPTDPLNDNPEPPKRKKQKPEGGLKKTKDIFQSVETTRYNNHYIPTENTSWSWGSGPKPPRSTGRPLAMAPADAPLTFGANQNSNISGYTTSGYGGNNRGFAVQDVRQRSFSSSVQGFASVDHQSNTDIVNMTVGSLQGPPEQLEPQPATKQVHSKKMNMLPEDLRPVGGLDGQPHLVSPPRSYNHTLPQSLTFGSPSRSAYYSSSDMRRHNRRNGRPPISSGDNYFSGRPRNANSTPVPFDGFTPPSRTEQSLGPFQSSQRSQNFNATTSTPKEVATIEYFTKEAGRVRPSQLPFLNVQSCWLHKVTHLLTPSL
jgi:hypothetical protein